MVAFRKGLDQISRGLGMAPRFSLQNMDFKVSTLKSCTWQCGTCAKMAHAVLGWIDTMIARYLHCKLQYYLSCEFIS